jgi:hypothetical protein
MVPLAASTFAVPCDRAQATPACVADTTAELLEDQLTELVISAVLESLKTPVAFSCCVSPTLIAAVLGETLML